MENPNFSTNIYLKYQNKIKKVNWRKHLTSEDFSYLVKSIYGLQGKILGFQAVDGTIYELSYLLKHKEHISQHPYQIIVKPDSSFSSKYTFLIEIKSFKHFEEVLEKKSRETMKVLAVFNEKDKGFFEECLCKLDSIASDFQDSCSFFWLVLSITEKAIFKKKFTFPTPVLAFYSTEEKFMEMPINELNLQNFSKLFKRIHQEHQTSVYSIDQTESSTASLNSFYVLDEANQQNEEEISQNTYVLDSKSITTYELNSARSEDERNSTEIYDIEERDAGESPINIEGNDDDLNDFMNENNVNGNLIKEQNKFDFKKKQEPDSSHGSYFLKKPKPIDKSSLVSSVIAEVQAIPQVGVPKQSEEIEDIGSLSPSKYTDFYTLLHDNVQKFEPEDYGMALCLYKEKDKDMFDLLNDCRKLNDKDLNSFLVSTFARKRFSLWLIDNFSYENIEKLNQEKNDRNSSVYTAYQCFKYDNDLDDLKGMLDKALHKENDTKHLRKPTDSIVENDYPDFSKNNEDFLKKYAQQDLYIIKEGSAKDEESPGMPMDFNIETLKKNDKKYKDMIIAMKDQINENVEETAKPKAFNLVLVGDNRQSEIDKKNSMKRKTDLMIECAKDEHPLAREVLDKFFEKGELEKNVKIPHYLKLIVID